MLHLTQYPILHDDIWSMKSFGSAAVIFTLAKLNFRYPQHLRLKLEYYLIGTPCSSRKEKRWFAVDKQESEIEYGRVKFLREENDLTVSQRDPGN